MRKLAELQRSFLTHGTQMSILGSFERLMDVSIDRAGYDTKYTKYNLTPRMFSSPKVTGLLPSFSLQS